MVWLAIICMSRHTVYTYIYIYDICRYYRSKFCRWVSDRVAIESFHVSVAPWPQGSQTRDIHKQRRC